MEVIDEAKKMRLTGKVWVLFVNDPLDGDDVGLKNTGVSASGRWGLT